MGSLKIRLFPKFLIVLIFLAVIPAGLLSRIIISLNNSSLQFEVQRYHHIIAKSLAQNLD
jgi:hypothetical protein